MELLDFPLMEEELAGALGIVVLAVAVGVRRDVRTEEEGLAVLHQDVGVLEVGVSLPERLDLRPGQRQAGFELLQDEVVVKGLLVRGNELLARVRFRRHGEGDCKA